MRMPGVLERNVWIGAAGLAVVALFAALSRETPRGGEAPPVTAVAPTPTPRLRALRDPEEVLKTEGCVTKDCHPRFASLPYQHGPLGDGSCLPCHTPTTGKHKFEKMAKTPFLCQSCHEPYPAGKARHPFADKDCEVCHDPHGGNDRFFFRREGLARLCLDCHGDRVKTDTEHALVARGACLACHEMHHANDKPLLRASRNQLCLRCHEEVATAIGRAFTVHQPAAEDCTLCHNPHGDGGIGLTVDGAVHLCQGCHTERFDEVSNAKFTHGALTETQQCLGCHDPHASRGRKLLKDTTARLCLGCHDKDIKVSEKETLENVKSFLGSHSHIHGPARQGSCTTCHNPHGSDHARILKYNFPSGFYANFDTSIYELCFHCHDGRMVTERESMATGFRNGTHNLHFLHVSREKGRTCRACHHEHASNSPLQIREEVPYGNWVMSLRFERTASGGNCQSACHTEYRYDRQQPVNNVPAVQ